MRPVVMALLAIALASPLASAQATSHAATFEMAKGFEDTMLIVSGKTSLSSSGITSSAAYFRTSGAEVRGLTKVCWTAVFTTVSRIECVDGPLVLEVPAGSSFGFKSATPYSTLIEAQHAITTFVDLSKADGFDGRLKVSESAILSMVSGRVTVGAIPGFPQGVPGGFTTMEADSVVHVRSATGTLLHTMKFDDAPMVIEGAPVFQKAFTAAVAVVPFGNGATAHVVPAKESVAAIGLSDERMDLLDQILRNTRLLSGSAKSAPTAILRKADVILSEIFNGALIRTRLSDDPKSLSDVGFAKFDELTITNERSDLTFDGTYTLVLGNLGPSFESSDVARSKGTGFGWWVLALFVGAAIVVAAWLWVRDGPVRSTEPGPQHWVARVASAIGLVVMFLVWDWQLNRLLGSSLLTTEGTGAGLGVLAAIELLTLGLAAVLIGLPVYLAVRYGLAIARKPQYLSLSWTAAVFLTFGLGILLMPALLDLVVGVVG